MSGGQKSGSRPVCETADSTAIAGNTRGETLFPAVNTRRGTDSCANRKSFLQEIEQHCWGFFLTHD